MPKVVERLAAASPAFGRAIPQIVPLVTEGCKDVRGEVPSVSSDREELSFLSCTGVERDDLRDLL